MEGKIYKEAKIIFNRHIARTMGILEDKLDVATLDQVRGELWLLFDDLFGNPNKGQKNS